MGLCLIAVSDWGPMLWGILQVALGLGFVIFVHELGHFAVAKWCGVQCDKFFVGFDIGGYKLSRKWGETEYGIGILPLGGYVKMMGQDDNPANFEAQLAESQQSAASPEAKEIIGPQGQRVFVNPRSYMAKSVPQRMAIISAGVIMNIIFAVIFAFIAYGVGVPEMPCAISGTAPSSAAWEAGLRTGDRILKLGEIENPTYEDLQGKALLGDLQNGVECVVQRANTGETETMRLIPRMMGRISRLGVSPAMSLRLSNTKAVVPGSAADKADHPFEPGDELVAINSVPLESYADLVRELALHNGEELEYTVRRGGESPKHQPFAPREGGELVKIVVPPAPLKGLGIVATLGPIIAVQVDSPAAKAGLNVGERVIAIDGVAFGAKEDGSVGWDPLTVEQQLQKLARDEQEVKLTIANEKGEEREVALTPRVVDWFEGAETESEPLAISALGIACHVQPTIQATVADSPASVADIKAGDQILSARIMFKNPQSEEAKEAKGEGVDEPLPVLQDETYVSGSVSWLSLANSGQTLDLRDEPALELQLKRDGKVHLVTVPFYTRSDAFSPKRGTILELQKEMRYASSLSEQASSAITATKRSLLGVYTFLGKIGRQVPMTALGGPVTIATQAYERSSEGFGKLLLFLTMLSANLAVINFLPIPMLDGGHMAFLTYEAIRGKPAGEKFVMVLQTAGLAFLLMLMAFVFGLDFGLIPRNL